MVKRSKTPGAASPLRDVLTENAGRSVSTLKGSSKIHFISYLILAGPHELFRHFQLIHTRVVADAPDPD